MLKLLRGIQALEVCPALHNPEAGVDRLEVAFRRSVPDRKPKPVQALQFQLAHLCRRLRQRVLQARHHRFVSAAAVRIAQAFAFWPD